MKKWQYITKNGDQGPVSPSELRDLYEAGTIGWETQIWAEGMASWEPLSYHRNLVKRHVAAPNSSEQQARNQDVEVNSELNRSKPKLGLEKNEAFSNKNSPPVIKDNSVSGARGWVVTFVVLAILGMLFFPPFQITYLGTIHNMGYGFLFSPPAVRGITASIAVPILLLQMLVIIGLGGALWFYFGRASQVDDINLGKSGNAKLFQRGLLTLLRVFRALVGLVFLWQLLGLLPVVSWITNPAAVTPDMMAGVFLKAILALIAGVAFAKLRHLINSLYSAWLGEPHPRLKKFCRL